VILCLSKPHKGRHGPSRLELSSSPSISSVGLYYLYMIIIFIRCLSGNTAEAIKKVDPQFIKVAKIEQSLTPGRNNGFLNMVQSMKNKAVQLDAAARQANNNAGSTSSSSSDNETASVATESDDNVATIPDLDGKGPKFRAIVTALQVLKPTSLNLVDNSYQHAGHAGNDMDGESHFELSIVASAFDGLNLVKRHKLVYMVLGDLMPQIHALQIQSLTPTEAEARGL
jgi:stress-induced morphogen